MVISEDTRHGCPRQTSHPLPSDTIPVVSQISVCGSMSDVLTKPPILSFGGGEDELLENTQNSLSLRLSTSVRFSSRRKDCSTWKLQRNCSQSGNTSLMAAFSALSLSVSHTCKGMSGRMLYVTGFGKYNIIRKTFPNYLSFYM